MLSPNWLDNHPLLGTLIAFKGGGKSGMRIARLHRRHLGCSAALAAILAAPAFAAPANVTGSDVNQLNLLSPFLNLNATAVGQQTLAANLASAIAVNQFAAARPGLEATSISDVNLLGSASNTIAGVATRYGPGANLGGGLPPQTPNNGVTPVQQYGGLGSLGPAFQAAVSPTGATAPAVSSLLVNAYSFNSQDLGVSKNYFANGTFNGSTAAVAPAGFTLPTVNGLPNTTTSVYDTAYGVSNTTAGQNPEGDSRPYQVSPNSVTLYDRADTSGSLNGNPAFPSGHTTYAFTDSILVGMLSPQNFQAMVLRGSEYGNSRIDLGAHYPLDVIASRSFVSYNLAQLLNGANPVYQVTNAVGSTTPFNLNGQFVTAATQLTSYLNTQTGVCGGSLAACAASNPYLTYSAATYSAAPFTANTGTTTAAQNEAIYRARLTYNLPTLSYTQAPREQAPSGGPDASILLATLYGGSSPQAQALAASVGGALYGNLSTATINEIIVNTETNALAAFYGTPLSYWSRIDLYDAAGYFQNVTGTFNLAAADRLNTMVTVAGANAALNLPAGVISGTGTITGGLTIQSGGAFAAQGTGSTAFTPLHVVGAASLQAGSSVQLTGVFLPGTPYTLISTTGAATVDPAATVDTSQDSNLMTLFTGALKGTAGSGVALTLTSHFASVAANANQAAVATALDRTANAGGLTAGASTFFNGLIVNNTAATAPATYTSLSGEGLAGQQQTALEANELFVRTVMGHNGVLNGDDHGGTGPLWGAGFGQHASLDGQAAQGSARLTSDTGGGVIGLDYPVTRRITLGVAGGYSSSSETISARTTTGTLDATHAALYGVGHVTDRLYVAATLSYAHFDVTTDRFVTGLGPTALETAKSANDEYLGRVEGGYRFAIKPVDLTPIAGFQAARLHSDGFAEADSNGAFAGLGVRGRDVDSDKSFVGVQVDGHTLIATAIVTPFVRATWEHEFHPDRRLDAALLAVPGSDFTVSGASAAEDAARVNAGLKVAVANHVEISASFDGAFSGRSESYGGNGGLKISW